MTLARRRFLVAPRNADDGAVVNTKMADGQVVRRGIGPMNWPAPLAGIGA